MFGRIRVHKLYIPLVTILGLAALFFAYSVLFVSKQETYMNERAFRLLSVVGDQLTNHFDNLQRVMAAALVQQTGKDGDPKEGRMAARYIERVAGRGSQISVLKESAPCPEDWKREGEMKLYLAASQTSLALKARFEAMRDGKPICSLEAQVHPEAEFREKFHHLSANYFDDILIATSSGEVLFESNLAGLRIGSLATLVAGQASNGGGKAEAEAKDGKSRAGLFGDISQFSNVREVRFAGGLYRLYMQPLNLQLFEENGAGRTVKTVICGMSQVDRQQAQMVSLPYSTLIWGVLGVFAGFGLLWPLLKVAYMSPTERLKRPHVFSLLASAVFVAAVLSAIVLNQAYMVRLDEEAQRQLDSLADRIDNNVKVELARVLTLMDRLESKDMQGALAEAAGKSWTKARVLEAGEFRRAVEAYPYFDNLFWADAGGRQIFKITVRGEATPQTPVADQTYFRAVRTGEGLKSLKGNPPEQGARKRYDDTALDSRFRLEPKYSRNTGEYFVIVAKPTQGAGLAPQLAGAAAQVVVTKFVSLQEPVMPGGFGYAVVDHDGLVQFHSSEGRNQIENFFKESHENPLIHAMVTAGTEGFVNSDYNGRQQLALVRPLPYLADQGMSLIVFRDTNYFRTINMACMLTFGLLMSLFGAPVLAAIALYVAGSGSYPLERLWPDRAANACYVRMIAAAACIAFAFAFRYPEMEIGATARAVLAASGAAATLAMLACWRPRWSEAIQAATVTLAIVVIVGGSPTLAFAGAYPALAALSARDRLSKLVARLSPAVLYVAAAFGLLATGVVLPCWGIFKITYHSISRLSVQTALQDRTDLLVRRSKTIRGRFADLQNGNAGGSLEWAVTRRVEDGLDRYDRPIFAPRDTRRPNIDWNKATDRVPAVERWIGSMAALFPHNTFGVQLRQASLVDNEKSWRTAVVRGYEVVTRRELPDGIPEESLRGAYPRWRVSREQMPGLGLLACVLLAWLGFIARKLFLTEVTQAPPVEPWTVEGATESSLLVIGHPKSGRSTAAARIPAKDWIDLAQMAASGNWTVPELKEGVVVVDNFEFDAENPASSQAKLKLMEELVFVHHKRVVLLSTIDPMFHAEASAATSPVISQALHRWAALLSGFQRLEMDDSTLNRIDEYIDEQSKKGKVFPAELAAVVREECGHSPQLRRIGIGLLSLHVPSWAFSRAQVIGELMDRANTYYRVVWSACTNEERLVLFQLARDGWANPKNSRAIQQLERRRLLRRSPALRIFNESFCRFVQSAQLPSDLAKWEQDAQSSAWTALKLGFTTAALAGGAWLLYTQQEVFHAGVGYVAAMGTASGAVISLLRSVSQARVGGGDKTTNA